MVATIHGFTRSTTTNLFAFKYRNMYIQPFVWFNNLVPLSFTPLFYTPFPYGKPLKIGAAKCRK